MIRLRCCMRDGRLDFLKGLVMWSVVMGHTINALCNEGNGLHTMLRTFDRPMFMCISGFLLKGSMERHGWKRLLLNKVTMLLVPAMLWMLISLAFGDRCFYYFLWAVCFCCAIVCSVHTCCRKVQVEGVVLIGIALLLHVVPVNVVNMSFLFPFFLLGYMSRRIVPVRWSWGVTALVVFVVLLMGVWSPQFSIWNSGGYVLSDPAYMIPVVLLRLGIGVAGVYAVSFLMGAVHDRLNDAAGVRFFERIGKETLAIYVMQHVVVEIGLQRLAGMERVSSVLVEHPWVAGYVVVPLVSLLLLLAMYEMALLLKKSACSKWVFGFRI